MRDKIEMIVLDLDGTAITSSGVVADSTVEALDFFRRAGVRIAVATGRSKTGAQPHIARIKPDIVILSGGAYIDCFGEVLADMRLSSDIIWRIIEEYRNRGCKKYILTGTDYSYISHDVDLPESNPKIHNFSERIDDEFSEISCNHADPELERLVLAMDPDIEMTLYSLENWRRFAHRNANKGFALKLVADKLNVNIDKVIAFGDDYNDIEMFKLVGYSVVMKNARDDVKKHAKYECGSNDEHGIHGFLMERAAQFCF